ncbi:MAG: 2-amino-4-hydroxy-6-hydroxymethyldihydropteridine diphosphokinase [Candidatus Eremiobacteraeota bacterium]|nr:2-amino-4-hydroxy-6-hydroxymethyldihydropteridine diphosphokinase [Candidatus Eremiobacteraeota bacterium]
MAVAAIGIGSNLGDALGNVRKSFEALRKIGKLKSVSSCYRSKPWGGGAQAQNEFINAAALVETTLRPHELLAALQRIEVELGRVPTYHWGPRIIDLDILYYDDVVVNEAALKIPHPHLEQRAFALVPLAEIDARYAAMAAAIDASDVLAL